LWIAWHEVLAICAKLGATIGDQQPPPLATPNPYTYVGMFFSTIDGVSRVELAEKSRRKLISAASMLKSESEMLVFDGTMSRVRSYCSIRNSSKQIISHK
jgi:hypothetical protein